MPNYIRPKSRGTTIFFAVCLADRNSTLLADEIVRLREAFRLTMAERPFEIVSIVVLPKHLHCIWRLPKRDGEYPKRWRLIKSRFSMGLECRPRNWSKKRRNERGIWQRRFWGEERPEIDPVDRFQ